MLKKILVTLLCVAYVFLVGCETQKYPSGRDTVASFADGMYQFVRTQDQLSLVNMETGDRIEPKVVTFKEVAPNIYVIGKNAGYTIVNYNNQKIKQNKQLNVFTDKEKKRFRLILEESKAMDKP